MVLCSAVLFAGCSALPRIGKGEAGTAPEGAQDELVYFVAEDGINVYAEPSANSSPIAELPLHTRVLRSEVQRGYAHVRTEDGGVEGWVDNARLIWRLPRDEAPAQPAATEPGVPGAAPDVPSAERETRASEDDTAPQLVPQVPQESSARTPAESAVDQPETPASTPPPAATEEKPEPSVFNPF